MPGFPQVIGVIAGATSGFTASLPLLVVPSGDGQTGILQVGGISATVAFPYSFNSDGQAASASAATGIIAWNGTSADRVRVANIGTDPGLGASGALVIQGSASGVPLPVEALYSMLADAQPALDDSGWGLVGWNGSSVDRVRVGNIGTEPGAGATGALLVQGSAAGTPIPVTGTLTSTQPYTATADAQPATGASAVALVAYNGGSNTTGIDRVRIANVGTALGLGVPGALVVQSSPNAAPFPIAAIGQGALFQVPAGTSNGTAIGAPPSGSQGVRVYVPINCDFKYTIASGPPGAPPAQVVEFNNPPNAQFPIVVDENLSAGQNLYVITPQTLNTKLIARFI